MAPPLLIIFYFGSGMALHIGFYRNFYSTFKIKSGGIGFHFPNPFRNKQFTWEVD